MIHMKLEFDAVDRKLLDHLHKTALAFEELKELSVTSSCVMTVCTVTVSQVLLGWAEQHSPFLHLAQTWRRWWMRCSPWSHWWQTGGSRSTD